MSEIPKVALEMAYQAEGAAAVGEVAWSQDADLALIGLRNAYLAMTAERDAFREAVGHIAQLASLEQDGSFIATPGSFTAAFNLWCRAAVDRYGCDDCAGQTFEDGVICCWTCGRAMPDAPSATEPQ